MTDPYRGPYRFTFPSSATINYEYPAGERHTVTRSGGGQFVINDPCEAMAFINGFTGAGFGYEPREARLSTRNIVAACFDRTLEEILDQGGPRLSAPPTGPDGRGTPEGSVQEETPNTLGARSGPPVIQISLDGTAPPPTSRGLRAERYFSPGADRATDTDVGDWVLSERRTQEETQEELTRIFRNVPDDDRPHIVFGNQISQLFFSESDPVIVATGQYEITVDEIHIPSRGFPIKLTRRYRSGPVWYGPWGFNWDHNYNMFARELLAGAVAIWTGVFSEQQYTPRGDGSFDAQPGVFRNLERIGEGSYILHDRDQMRYFFSRSESWPDPVRIPLVAIEDHSGNRHQLTYDAAGQLSRVTDDSGRYIEFSYGRCGLLERISTHAGRVWRYIHDDDIEHLIAVIAPGTIRGFTARYVYDRFQSHPALQHNITAVYENSGRLAVENLYGDDPASDDFNRMICQRFGDAETWFVTTLLQYVPPDPASDTVPAYRVEVISPARYIIHTFNYRGDLLESSTRLIADRSYRLVVDTFRYDAQGNLTEQRQPNGLTKVMRYDSEARDPRARGNLLELSEVATPLRPMGSRTIARWTYESQFHQLKKVEYARGAATEYIYDYEEGLGRRGLPIRVIHPDVLLPDGTRSSASETIRYNARGQVVEQISAESRRRSIEYFESGLNTGFVREISEEGVDVLTSTFTYDSHGNIASIRRGEGVVVEYEYDAAGRLVLTRQASIAGGRGDIRRHYDANGQLRFLDSPRGDYSDAVIRDNYIRHEIRYDAFGFPAYIALGANTAGVAIWRLVNNLYGDPLQITDPESRITRFIYDERGKLVQQVDHWRTPDERATRYTYDVNGNVTRVIDPEGNRLDFEYDGYDRLRRILQPGAPDARTRIELRYSNRDEPEEQRTLTSDGRELFREGLTYDELGRLSSYSAGPLSERYTYDRDGLLLSCTDHFGATWSASYDSTGRQSWFQDPLGNRTEFSYDNLYRLTSIRSGPRRVQFGFDERDRLTRITDALGNTTRFAYDDRDLLASNTSPGGRRDAFEYDATGLLRASTTGIGARLSYRRDRLGRVLAATDPLGRETQFEYGTDNDWLRLIYPDGTALRRTFDRAGRLLHESSPSGTAFHYVYDDTGYVSEIAIAPSSEVAGAGPVQFTRDELGRVLSVTEAGNRVEFSYDAVGRIVSENQAGGVVRIAYSGAERAAELTYPDGRIDRYEYDALGRVARISVVAASSDGTGAAPGTELARYEYAGKELRRRLTPAAVTEYDYDAVGHITSIHHRNTAGATNARVEYLYNADGQREIIWNEGEHSYAQLCAYDANGRLSSVRRYRTLPRPGVIRSQADVDAFLAGLTSLEPESETTYVINVADERERKLLRMAGRTSEQRFTYNSLGQVVLLEFDGERVNFEFDMDGRRVLDSRHRYVYDALGRLREVRSRATNELLLAMDYDAVGRLSIKRSGSRTEQFTYRNGQQLTHNGRNLLWAAGNELLHESGPRQRWFHQDALASVISVTGGTTDESFDYDVFGLQSETATDDGMFAGHFQLNSLGLYYARARAYDAASGLFLQRDPVYSSDSANLYAYARHDPVNLTDPTGEAVPAIIAIAVIVGELLGIGYAAYDASEHPDHYGIFGSASEQAAGQREIFFKVVGSAAVAGVAAISSEAILATAGLSTLSGSGAALSTIVRAPVFLGRYTLPVSTSIGFHGLASATSGFYYRALEHRIFPEQVEAPTLRSVRNDALLGGGLRFLGLTGSFVWQRAAGRWANETAISFAAQNSQLFRPRVYGVTTPYGRVYMNLDRLQQGTARYAQTRGHEFFHRLLRPFWVRNQALQHRWANAVSWMYRNSQAWRAGEEFATQTLTTGSIRQGIGQLLKPGYRLNRYRVAGELLGLSSLIGAFVYRNDIGSGIQAILDAESVERTEERGVRGPVITGSAK